MDADGLKGMYLRWLTEMWGGGKYEVAAEIFTEDVRDHNAYRASRRPGRAGLGGPPGPQRRSRTWRSRRTW